MKNVLLVKQLKDNGPYERIVLGRDNELGRALVGSEQSLQAAHRILRARGLTYREAAKAAAAVMGLLPEVTK